VHLDDYPYVHLMRLVSQELRTMELPGVFFDNEDRPFKDARDWGTLTVLLNQDYERLRLGPWHTDDAVPWLLNRFDVARSLCGMGRAFGRLPRSVHEKLTPKIRPDCEQLFADLNANIPNSLEGRTVIIECARGGPASSAMPLSAPLGYKHTLETFSPAILSSGASILYVWVTPEQSREKNRARAKPGQEGDASILFHGVPEIVMTNDYGTDDMEWLLQNSSRPGCVKVITHDHMYILPAARLDNRADLTTFVREEDPKSWFAGNVVALHSALSTALSMLHATRECMT
jgi:hypothetical protein